MADGCEPPVLKTRHPASRGGCQGHGVALNAFWDTLAQRPR